MLTITQLKMDQSHSSSRDLFPSFYESLGAKHKDYNAAKNNVENPTESVAVPNISQNVQNTQKEGNRQTKPGKFQCTLSVAKKITKKNEDNPYKCTVCDSKFSQSSILQRHLRTHTGVKPYKCTVCYSKFSQSSNLQRHLRTHTGVKPYKCTVCYSNFSQKCILQRHLKTHTEVKPYRCTVCDSKFRESYTLIVHMRTHTGEKPYKCTLCDLKFTRSYSLKVHNMKIHSG